MRFSFIFILTFVSLVSASFADQKSKKEWCKRALQKENDRTQTESLLLSGRVVSIRPLHEGLSDEGKTPSGTNKEIYIVEFEGGIKAVFKPEKYLWSSIGELAAYRLSEFLNLDIVPTTVLREIDGKIGSLQLYIENDYMSESIGWSGRRELYNELPQTARDRLALFHYLVGQSDRHLENIIIDRDGRVWAIDNEVVMGNTYWRYGDYPFVQQGKQSRDSGIKLYPTQFPFAEVQNARGTDEEDLRDLLSSRLRPYLSDEQIEARVQWSKDRDWAPISYVIWNRALWIQRTVKSMGPPIAETITQDFRDKLQELDRVKLREILPDQFTEDQVEQFMMRRDEILFH